MRKVLSVALAVAMVLGISGAALAWWGGPGMMGYGPQGNPGGGWGPGWGHGPMRGGGGRGPGHGPCAQQWQQGGAAPAAAIDDAKAKEIATEYVKTNLTGYQVEKLVKFERPRGAMYQVELKGPQGEIQYLRINPFGYVMPPRFAPGRALSAN